MYLAFFLPIAIPSIYYLTHLVLPPHYFEPYAYWDASTLNDQKSDGGPAWRNMGWWANTDDFSTANAALAQKLLEFAGSESGGVVLDVAHGSGESLVMHLSQEPPPKALHALTSLPSDTARAQELVAARLPNNTVPVRWYTSSAVYRPGKDLNHPLNPMRGYMGSPSTRSSAFDDYEDDDEADADREVLVEPEKPEKFDLIYVLDAIYHFPPSVPHFLAQARQALSPGGILAYTDVLPPPTLSPLLSRFLLPTLLHVPSVNLVDRPSTPKEYKASLEQMGYVNVKVEDWSEGVWPGFRRNLEGRGGVWAWVGRGVGWAEERGWKFIGVRAERPA